MREIKFRAWSKKEKRMINASNVIYQTIPVAPTKQGFRLKSVFTLMQYTGLKDKNGKEIYEGDIVKFIKLERKEGSTFEEATGKDWEKAYNKIPCFGKVLWSNNEAKFYVRGKEEAFYDNMGSKFSWNELEVIGNIYENKKLLKEAAQ